MPTGRPSEYRDELANEIIALMAMGLSVTASAANLGFHRDTLYEWEKQHPTFSDALKLGRGKRVLFLEKRLLTEDSGPKVTASIFALKNADANEWREKHEITGKDGAPLLEPSPLREVAKAILAVLGRAALDQEEPELLGTVEDAE